MLPVRNVLHHRTDHRAVPIGKATNGMSDKPALVHDLLQLAAHADAIATEAPRIADSLPRHHDLGENAQKMMAVQLAMLKQLAVLAQTLGGMARTIAADLDGLELPAVAPPVSSPPPEAATVPPASVYDVQSRVRELTSSDTDDVQDNSNDWDP